MKYSFLMIRICFTFPFVGGGGRGGDNKIDEQWH